VDELPESHSGQLAGLARSGLPGWMDPPLNSPALTTGDGRDRLLGLTRVLSEPFEVVTGVRDFDFLGAGDVPSAR
jgi:hypothetical protein